MANKARRRVGKQRKRKITKRVRTENRQAKRVPYIIYYKIHGGQFQMKAWNEAQRNKLFDKLAQTPGINSIYTLRDTSNV